MNFKPLHDRVVIRCITADEKSQGGIIIPDSAQEKPQEGEVLAVGEGKDLDGLTVQVGDRVLFGKWSGSELKIEGQDVLIMKEEDILGILRVA